MSGKEEKLFKALKDDEALIEHELTILGSLAQQVITVQVYDRLTKTTIPIKARQFTDEEILRYVEEEGEIDKRLATAISPEEAKKIPLTPDQNRKLYALMDKYIELATGIPAEKLKERTKGNVRIRTALFTAILRASMPTEEEIEEIGKFR
jgi:hypothetical protein